MEDFYKEVKIQLKEVKKEKASPNKKNEELIQEESPEKGKKKDQVSKKILDKIDLFLSEEQFK